MKRLTLLFLVAAGIAAPGGYVSGGTACPSSGAIQVTTSQFFLRQLTVSALTANTGKIYVGGSNTSATAVPPIGGELVAGSNYNSTDNTSSINPQTVYFACTVSSDAISWVGHQ